MKNHFVPDQAEFLATFLLSFFFFFILISIFFSLSPVLLGMAKHNVNKLCE